MIMALTLLLAADDVLEEVDGDLLIGWEVDAAFHCTELIAFPFCTILCSKGFSGDSMVGRSLTRNLGGVVLLHLIGFFFNNDRKIFSRLLMILWR